MRATGTRCPTCLSPQSHCFLVALRTEKNSKKRALNGYEKSFLVKHFLKTQRLVLFPVLQKTTSNEREKYPAIDAMTSALLRKFNSLNHNLRLCRATAR